VYELKRKEAVLSKELEALRNNTVSSGVGRAEHHVVTANVTSDNTEVDVHTYIACIRIQKKAT